MAPNATVGCGPEVPELSCDIRRDLVLMQPVMVRCKIYATTRLYSPQNPRSARRLGRVLHDPTPVRGLGSLG